MAGALLLLFLLTQTCCRASIIFNESADTIALCPENGLSDDEGITLTCNEPSSAIHVEHFTVHKYVSINHTDCSDPDELRCLLTLTDELVNECEGIVGNCTFYPLNSCSGINFLEVRYECVRAELIVNWCSDMEMTNASNIYLQTNDFTLSQPPPTSVSCQCDVMFSEPQSLTLHTYFMELEPPWEKKCEYDWWKLIVDDVTHDRKCDTIKREETTHDVLERLTLELNTDYMATDENGIVYRGGWLKVSTQNSGIHLKCKIKSEDGIIQTTMLGLPYTMEETTPIPTPSPPSRRKRTTTSAPSTTTKTFTELPPTTTLDWAPLKLHEQPEFIVGLTVGIVVPFALVIAVGYFIITYRKSRRGSRELNSNFQYANGEMFSNNNNNNNNINNNNNNNATVPKETSAHEYDATTVTTEEQQREAALRSGSSSSNQSSHPYQQLISQPSPLYAAIAPPSSSLSQTISV